MIFAVYGYREMRRTDVTRREAIQLAGACLIAGLSGSCGDDPVGNRKMESGARKTPAPPVDIAKAIPELKVFAKTAVRLHPRRGESVADASKIAGTIIWPAAERWPECDEHQCSLVTALQLRKEDVPEVGFKGASDLLQVLWCPNDHEPGYCPAPQVFWRNRAAITNVRSAPGPTRFEREYLPEVCVLSPERVVEYPNIGELSEDLKRKIDQSEELQDALEAMQGRQDLWRYPDNASDLYQFWLSTAAGTKVGGYPGWIQDPEYPPCPCGATMEHLVTFASLEFDGVTWGRWLPLDERGVLTASYDARQAVQSAPNWTFGDAGDLYLFVCRQCEQWPIKALMQGS